MPREIPDSLDSLDLGEMLFNPTLSASPGARAFGIHRHHPPISRGRWSRSYIRSVYRLLLTRSRPGDQGATPTAEALVITSSRLKRGDDVDGKKLFESHRSATSQEHKLLSKLFFANALAARWAELAQKQSEDHWRPYEEIFRFGRLVICTGPAKSSSDPAIPMNGSKNACRCRVGGLLTGRTCETLGCAAIKRFRAYSWARQALLGPIRYEHHAPSNGFKRFSVHNLRACRLVQQTGTREGCHAALPQQASVCCPNALGPGSRFWARRPLWKNLVGLLSASRWSFGLSHLPLHLNSRISISCTPLLPRNLPFDRHWTTGTIASYEPGRRRYIHTTRPCSRPFTSNIANNRHCLTHIAI